MQERNNMLKAQGQVSDEAKKDMVKLTPMTPLTASSTVVNLLLATGPFSYPYSFVRLGPIVSSVIMAITCVLAYVSATYMVEAISMANSQADESTRRRDSLFNEECYKTPQL